VNFALSPEIDVSDFDNVHLQYRRWLNVEDAHFDQASIYVNGELAWVNSNSDQGNSSTLHHTDNEWRFHDVDITPYVQDGKVQVKWEIASDGGLELGGWTLDDVCIVGFRSCGTDCIDPFCGDAIADDDEQCDDGNNIDDDACSNTCLVKNSEDAGCCSTGSGAASSSLVLAAGLTIVLRRRRRRKARPCPHARPHSV
jgi:cysteine-rich repeat protein